MSKQQRKMSLARILSGAGVLILAGCGGSGGGEVAVIPSTTTPFTTTVIDGAIQNALVCLDKNSNGVCDPDELHAKTDIAGKATIDVPNAEIGKYPVLAVVGTDAVDADSGAVRTAYTMSAPLDQSAVVSPLTTLVQRIVATNKVSTKEAESVVQSALGMSMSLFQDYTKGAASTDTSPSPALVARLLVLTMQEQAKVISDVVGRTADDGVEITQSNVDQAIQKKLLVLLPSLSRALIGPSVIEATTPAAKESALLAAASTLVSNFGLSSANMSTVVAINHKADTTNAVVPYVPSGGIRLTNLRYADSSNFYLRRNTFSLAQDTPSADKTHRSVERRLERVMGYDTTWGVGQNPASGLDLSWNGTAWAGCPINFENEEPIRDINGNNRYTYCGRETGTDNLVSVDIGGQPMIDTYNKIQSAGYSNFSLTNAAVALGSTIFPLDSKLFYQSGVTLATAVSYNPRGVNSPIGTSAVVGHYSETAAVDAALNGGIIEEQPEGRGCRASELDGNGTYTPTLESLVASYPGNPCINSRAGTFVYRGTTYSSGLPNESWGAFTLGIGSSGTAPLNSGVAPGYYSGNTKFRVAFKGAGANPVTYYACQERFTNGSTRNCLPIGTGSYSIETLGDGRALTFNNIPMQIRAMRGSEQVYVERGGHVFYGYKSNLGVYNVARLNTIAANALLTQLGVPSVDPEVPLALTFGSYQGVWDLWVPALITVDSATQVMISNTGGVSCQKQSTGVSITCAITSFNPATGEFVGSINPAAGVTSALSGNMNFMTGLGSGTFNSPSTTPSTGTFVMGRR